MEKQELLDQIETLRADNNRLRDELAESEISRNNTLHRLEKEEELRSALKDACNALCSIWAEEHKRADSLYRVIEHLCDFIVQKSGGRQV